MVSHDAATATIVPDSVREVVAARLARLSPPARTDDRDRRRRRAARRPRTSSRSPSTCRRRSSTPRSASWSPAGLLTAAATTALAFRVRALARPRHRRGDGRRHVARRRAHLAVAEAIEEVHAADRRPVLAELARHFAAAVPIAPVDKAVDYGRRAAAQAVRSAAYDEAASHLDAVLALGPPDLRARRGARRSGRRRSCGWACTRRAASAAARRSRWPAASAPPTSPPRRRCCSSWPRTSRASPADRPSSCCAGDRPDRRRQTPLQVRLQASLGRALAIEGRHDEATERHRRRRRPGTTDRRRRRPARRPAGRHHVGGRSGHDPRRGPRAGGARPRRSEDLWSIAYGSANQCRAQIALGDLDDASLALDRFRRATATGRFSLFQLMAIHLETILAIAAGDLAAAEALAEHGLALDAADESPASAGVYGVQMFTIRRAQGRLAEVAPVLRLARRGGRPAAGLAPRARRALRRARDARRGEPRCSPTSARRRSRRSPATRCGRPA